MQDKATLLPRFADKIKIDEHSCWIFNAAKDRAGYGRFCHEGKNILAHRYAYEQLLGPIPDGLHLDHYRNNEGPRNAPCSKACCNPEHLEAVPHAVNVRRGRGGQYQASRTHCPQGHEYNERNTYHYTKPAGTPGRGCRVCRGIRSRECRARKNGRQGKSNV